MGRINGAKTEMYTAVLVLRRFVTYNVILVLIAVTVKCRGWLMHSQPVSVQHQQQDHTGTLHCVLDTLGGSRLGRFLSSPSVRTAHAIWVATEYATCTHVRYISRQ